MQFKIVFKYHYKNILFELCVFFYGIKGLADVLVKPRLKNVDIVLKYFNL